MILTWTPEFLDTALSTLTEQQQAAIHLATDVGSIAKPGTVRLKTFGFSSFEEYSTALEKARAKLRAWFATWGIRKMDDLDCVQRGSSSEGRIQEKAAMGRKR